MRLSILLVLPALLLFGCRAETSNNADVNISIEISPEASVVGEESIVLVSLSDSAGNPVNDATVNLRGDMNHAGMTPVLGESSNATNGAYEIPFEFSMGGDWIITVDVTLADGSTASRSFNINGIGSSGAESSTGAGGVSAAYFSIRNNGTEDIRLVSVTAAGVGETSIHQTIVENNVARMEEVENGLLIPAGETVALAPGGHHVMLMNIETGLVEGETLVLNLSFNNGTSLSVEAPIELIEPEEGASAESETILVSGAWLRPTTNAGGD